MSLTTTIQKSVLGAIMVVDHTLSLHVILTESQSSLLTLFLQKELSCCFYFSVLLLFFEHPLIEGFIVTSSALDSTNSITNWILFQFKQEVKESSRVEEKSLELFSDLAISLHWLPKQQNAWRYHFQEQTNLFINYLLMHEILRDLVQRTCNYQRKQLFSQK